MATTRQSNMELLRVVTMIGILLLHANYFCFGYPKLQFVGEYPVIYPARYFLEYLCISAVNVFVMISGWFGIRTKMSGALRLLYQILFWGIVVAVFVWACGGELGSVGKIFKSACGMWFVWSYLALYILSPALNAFVEKASEMELRNLLLAAFALELFDVWMQLNVFAKGFSPIHFAVIYLLARYLRLYGAEKCKSVPTWWLAGLFFALTLLSVFAQWSIGTTGNAQLFNRACDFLTTYSNPLCVAQAALLILTFARLKLQSKVINFLAAGALAVYLFHQNPYLRQDYCGIFRLLHAHYSLALALFFDALAICGIYLAAVLVDRLRQWTWKPIEKRLK